MNSQEYQQIAKIGDIFIFIFIFILFYFLFFRNKHTHKEEGKWF